MVILQIELKYRKFGPKGVLNVEATYYTLVGGICVYKQRCTKHVDD
jgi:hypothetical protein